MKPFTQLRAMTVPLPIKDIDTDMIIPAQYLTSTSRDGYGENLFRRLRDGDPNFPLNQSRYSGAQILITDSNFGCGSSREHAVWALLGAGFRVVIGKSFADIFSGNSAKNGLVLVALEAATVDRLLQAADQGGYELSVDLKAQVVTLPDGEKIAFPFDPFRKHCILEGLEDIDYLCSARDEIAQFRRNQEANRFYSTLAPNRS